MKFTFNSPEMKGRRQDLRNEAPPSEQILWKMLKGKQLGGHKFRRQYGVGPFVLDFYCPEIRLGIEIDGDSHFEPGAQKRDEEREDYIRAHGIAILRFTNLDVKLAPEAVLEKIIEALPTSTTP